VLGSGPGGYTAAFRAADLGSDTVLIERYATLGGVCLNVGCIPSKALLHAARLIDEASHSADIGISFGKPDIDIGKLGAFKDKVVAQLTGGLGRHEQAAQGHGRAGHRQVRLGERDRSRRRRTERSSCASKNASSPRDRRR
jgi:dihydrolipoamide dehydrogenase